MIGSLAGAFGAFLVKRGEKLDARGRTDVAAIGKDRESERLQPHAV